MEEKKLTDGEIIKSLEVCGKDFECNNCPYADECCERLDGSAGLLIQALDLIHRLQDENERLKKEHERIAWSKQEYLDWVHGFLSTHTEMKDRGEKYEMFDRDWMCNVFWVKIKGSIEYIIDLENQRNNLQKQVDELKELNAKYLDSIESVQAGRCRFRCGLTQQAVKDTAKEICLKIIKEQPQPIKEKWVEWFKKEYGVEVE